VAAEEASDTLRVRVAMKDEVHLGDVLVTNAGVAVADSLYSLVRPDSSAAGADRASPWPTTSPLHPSSENSRPSGHRAGCQRP